MYVASHYKVGRRFVQGYLEAVASSQLAKRGLSLEESRPLLTPRFLGFDEFAYRKGYRYDTILLELSGSPGARSEYRTQERQNRRCAGTALQLREGGSSEYGYEDDLPGSRAVVLTALFT
jgi:hypothetical protein